MKNTYWFLCVFAVALSITAPADAATVSLEGNFIGGLYGTFNVQYQSPAPGLQLKSIAFDLQPGLYVDPTFAPPGALLPFPFLSLSGAAETGFAGVSGVFDGSTSFELLFTDFDAGESFNFELDVDGPCGGFLCAPGAITLGSEFAGVKMTGVFGGTGYNTTGLGGIFSETGRLTAAAAVRGDVAQTPEPGTTALFATGLILVAIRAKVVRSTRSRSSQR